MRMMRCHFEIEESRYKAIEVNGAHEPSAEVDTSSGRPNGGSRMGWAGMKREMCELTVRL